MEEIKKEMEDIIIPFAKESGLSEKQALQMCIRYGYERQKDYEWEANDRAMQIIQAIIDQYNLPINRFQRTYGRICLN